jgi:hypothetical protein
VHMHSYRDRTLSCAQADRQSCMTCVSLLEKVDSSTLQKDVTDVQSQCYSTIHTSRLNLNADTDFDWVAMNECEALIDY